MGQVTIYLEDEIEAKMDQAAKSAHLSKSKWVARLISAEVSNNWPKSVADLAGAWGDFPSPEEIRQDIGNDEKRETF
ncbi:MAG: CopG family transcriptional regulator [Pseudomonadota bacterium]